MRLKLTIAYDGRPYGGWQSQPNADTIQDRLEAAAVEIGGQAIRIHGSGRTDAGVHALAQVAHFDPPEHLTMNPANWLPALNTKLPASIRVMECEEVPGDFHARFSTSAKHYRYRISTRPVLPPLDAGLAWHQPQGFDPDLLHEALKLFRGTHDFRAFGARRGNETPASDFHRTLHDVGASWTADGPSLDFTGDGFLYKMVRMLTGSAIAVAAGKLPLDDLGSLLHSPGPTDRTMHCAPADGLTLVGVDYEPRAATPAHSA